MTYKRAFDHTVKLPNNTHEIVEPSDFELSIGAILSDVTETLKAKNSDYNSAFEKLFDEYGDFYAGARLTEKIHRYKRLMDNEKQVKDESIEDTLKDLIGYCVLTIHERRKAQ